MIKPKILSNENIMKAHEGEKCRDCGKSIAQAQNDYCYKEMLGQILDLFNPTYIGIVGSGASRLKSMLSLEMPFNPS